MLKINKDASVSVVSRIVLTVYLTRQLSEKETLALIKHARTVLPADTVHLIEEQTVRGKGRPRPARKDDQ